MRIRISKTTVCLTAFLMVLFAFAAAAAAQGSTVNGTLWIDSDTDGVFDKGENGLRNSTLILERLSPDGEVTSVAEITTGQNGSFAFSDVPGGTYRIAVKLAGEYRFTLHGKDSAALPASGNASKTTFFPVGASETKTVNIGCTKSASSISLVAFEDLNANGGRRTSEPLVRNVLITLMYEYEGTRYEIASATTNKDGEARISSLSPGTYTLIAACPEDYGYGPTGEKVNQWYNCFLPVNENIGTTGSFELPVKTGMAMGIGLVRAGKVTGRVWLDKNADGVRDAADSGLSGFTVTLVSPDGGVTRSAVTSEDGTFVFAGLQTGTYRLEADLSSDWMFTSGGSVFSDPTRRKDSCEVSVTAGKTTDAGLIGVTPDTAVTVTAFIDNNFNGILDGGDLLMGGVEITLETNGEPMRQITDGITGSCAFRSLYASEAVLACTLPEGFVFTSGGGDSMFTNRDGTFSASRVIPLRRGTTASFMIGVTQPSSVRGKVYEDSSGNYSASALPLSGFRVLLLDKNDEQIGECLTDDNGDYRFDNIPGGTYRVRVIFNDPFIASVTVPADGPCPNRITSLNMDHGDTDLFELPANTAVTYDAALYQAGSLQGYVLLNPAYDELATNEGGLKGVAVTLLNEQGVQVSGHLTDTTNDEGFFYIKGVYPGNYLLCYTLPEGAVMVTPVMGTYQWTGSLITVEKGTLLTVPSIGAVYTTDFSGTVVPDDKCTVRDPVQATVTVTSGTFGTVLSRTTDESGNFAFNGLLPDEYTIDVDITDGYIITGSGDGFIPMTPRDRAAVVLNFDMGSDWTGKRITVSLPSALSVRFYYDANDSGSPDENDSGAEKLTFTLTGPGGSADYVSGEDGVFTAENLYPGDYRISVSLPEDAIMTNASSREGAVWAYDFTLTDGAEGAFEIGLLKLGVISGFVWNMDGENDAVAGREIVLMKGEQETARTVSSHDGSFAFEGLRPGTYRLTCELPEDYLFAREQDARERNSVILNTGSLDIDLAMGAQLTDSSIGIGAIGSIGDFAWLDENGNGLQDMSEKGMPGIRIDLYQYGELIASAETDVYGRYSFSELYPGTYSIIVTMPAELKTTSPRTDYPLVCSVLPESDDTVITLDEVVVPSGAKNTNYDLGFVLRTEGVYPQSWYTIPVRDWTPYTKR